MPPETLTGAEASAEIASGTSRLNSSAKPSSRLKSAITTIVKIGLAVGLIYWMINKGVLDLGVLARLASPWLIAVCLFCVFMQVFINNYRWLLLMRGQGLVSTIRYTMPLSLIGMFFSFVMPGGVGGDVVKGYYVFQDYPEKKFAAGISIFMDRVIGFFIMIATAFFALFFNWSKVAHSPELQSVALGVTLLFLAFIIFFTLSLSRRIGHRVIVNSYLGKLLFEKMPGGKKIRQIYENVHAYRKDPSVFIKACLLSLMNQIFIVAFVAAVAFAMDIHEVPFGVYFFLVPVGIVVLALPISPAGIGVGQAAFYFLFSLYLGKSSQLGPTAVTMLQLTNFAWGLFGAFFYLRRKKPVLLPES